MRSGLAGCASGDVVRVVWRFGERSGEWFANVGENCGSMRAPVWRIAFFATSEGALNDDDVSDDSGGDDGDCASDVSRMSTLPPGAADNVDVLDVAIVSAVSSSSSLVAPTAAVDPPAVSALAIAHHPPSRVPQAVVHGRSSTSQIGPYPVVPDICCVVPAGLFPSSSTIETGECFLKLKILDEADARVRATPLAWAATTTSVRRGHLSDLRDLYAFIEARPIPNRSAPIDVLCVQYVHDRRVERNWHWSTAHRHASGLVGAFLGLPFYADGNPRSVNPMAWARFRAMLSAIKRLTTAQGQREPETCTAADVCGALSFASPRAGALLVLCCPTSGFFSVLQ
jgi:hypothetical protein